MHPTTESSAKRDPYAPWRQPDFRRYAFSWFLIVFSRRVEVLALGAFLVDVVGGKQAALLLGILGLVQALPVMVLFIPAGQLGDRFDRRIVMILSYSLSVAASIGLLAAAAIHASIGWMFLCLAVAAVGWSLGNPARQAMLPLLVPPKTFSNAVAWNSTVFYVASVTGPVVGGLTMGIVKRLGHSPNEGLVFAFALVVVCRAVAVAAIALLRHRTTNHAPQAVSWQSLLAGIRFVWRTKLILATITLDLFAVFLGGVTYLMPIFAKEILRVGDIGLGLLLAADMVGALCMAILLAHLPPLRRPGAALFCATAGFGAATVIFGLSKWFWLSLLMMFLVGALDNISVVVRHTLVQMLTPDAMRGRVSAVNGIFIVASNDLGGSESGFTARLFGPVVSAVAGGIGAMLVVAIVALKWPQLRKIGSLDSLEPISPTETDREA